MGNQFERTNSIIGTKGIENLKKAHVAVFGIGGVGGYVVESLVRVGVGELSIIDKDIVEISNINRQIVANHDTIGRAKVDVMKERCLLINPEVKIHVYKCFFLPQNADEFDFRIFDYIVDAVDTVTAKLELVQRAKEVDTPMISCMGAGNKMDSSKFHIADLYDTSICPLAKVMRHECKKRGIRSLRVLYSNEKPIVRAEIPGSTSFAPAVAGLLIAEEVFRKLL